jgi:hypothetical protein
LACLTKRFCLNPLHKYIFVICVCDSHNFVPRIILQVWFVSGRAHAQCVYFLCARSIRVNLTHPIVHLFCWGRLPPPPPAMRLSHCVSFSSILLLGSKGGLELPLKQIALQKGLLEESINRGALSLIQKIPSLCNPPARTFSLAKVVRITKWPGVYHYDGHWSQFFWSAPWLFLSLFLITHHSTHPGWL